jgi:hypothetical protein
MAGLPAGVPTASATGRWPANGSEASSITAKLDAAATSSMTLIYSPCCQRVDRSIPTVPAEPAAGRLSRTGGTGQPPRTANGVAGLHGPALQVFRRAVARAASRFHQLY